MDHNRSARAFAHHWHKNVSWVDRNAARSANTDERFAEQPVLRIEREHVAVFNLLVAKARAIDSGDIAPARELLPDSRWRRNKSAPELSYGASGTSDARSTREREEIGFTEAFDARERNANEPGSGGLADDPLPKLALGNPAHRPVAMKAGSPTGSNRIRRRFGQGFRSGSIRAGKRLS